MKELTQETFDREVLQADRPVMVDFWAPWCGPCKMVAPILEEAAAELPQVQFAKVNVDEHPQLAQSYNILSIPTFIVFKNGQPVEQFSGLMGKEDFKARLSRHL